eukprot:2336789-Rhodomonas_salina.1
MLLKRVGVLPLLVSSMLTLRVCDLHLQAESLWRLEEFHPPQVQLRVPLTGRLEGNELMIPHTILEPHPVQSRVRQTLVLHRVSVVHQLAY